MPFFAYVRVMLRHLDDMIFVIYAATDEPLRRCAMMTLFSR